MNLDSSKSIFYHNFDCGPHRASNLDIHKLNTNNLLIQKLIMNQVELLEILMKTRRSVEHCTPHADGAWLNELGWSP